MLRPGVVPGILLILFGILIGLERITILSYIFEQFWALVIIIPSLTSIRKNGITRGNIIGMGLGLSLFSATYFETITRLLGPLTLLIVGLTFLIIPNQND